MKKAADRFKILDKHLGVVLRNEVGAFLAGAYKTLWRGQVTNHLLLYSGLEHPTPIRIQSGCLTGDVFGDQRCDCHSQLVRAMQYIHDTKNGGLIYSVDDDGRGRGTLTKLKVYHYRDRFGGSSDDACRALGLKYDERDYYAVSRILLDLGLERIILLSENGNKKQALEENGVTVIDAKGIFGG